MKYKVGDKVRIVSKRIYDDNFWSDEMDKWLNKVMTVRSICGTDYKMEEDINENSERGWFWEECMIAGLTNENKMPEVAALLGVEIGEEFEISGKEHNPYKITEKGVVDRDGDVRDFRLRHLLTGEWKIIKKPWKPKNMEHYYYIRPDGGIVGTNFVSGGAFDHMAVYSGNYFCTGEEAEANREAIMDKFGWN